MYFSNGQYQCKKGEIERNTIAQLIYEKRAACMSTKIAILMGRCLFLFYVERLWLSLTKWRSENLKRMTKKNEKELTRLTKMVAAENQSILCRGRKTGRFCAVAAEAIRVPNFLLWISFGFKHTVGIYLSVPTHSNWPISNRRCRSTRTRNCTAAGKREKSLPCDRNSDSELN